MILSVVLNLHLSAVSFLALGFATFGTGSALFAGCSLVDALSATAVDLSYWALLLQNGSHVAVIATLMATI